MNNYKYRIVETNDLSVIKEFPRDADELYFMYPKATFPLTIDQLQTAIENRFDSMVVLVDDMVAGFANFYEVNNGLHCSIGNVIVNPTYRGKGVATYLIQTMEYLAINKYHAKEVHISCFNANVTGLLLYHKLGFVPYELEKRFDQKLSPVALIKMKKEVQK